MPPKPEPEPEESDEGDGEDGGDGEQEEQKPQSGGNGGQPEGQGDGEPADQPQDSGSGAGGGNNQAPATPEAAQEELADLAGKLSGLMEDATSESIKELNEQTKCGDGIGSMDMKGARKKHVEEPGHDMDGHSNLDRGDRLAGCGGTTEGTVPVCEHA